MSRYSRKIYSCQNVKNAIYRRTYRFSIIGSISTWQRNALWKINSTITSHCDLVTRWVELRQCAVRISSLETQNLMAQNVLPGSNGRRQRDFPGAVLQRESLACPRRLCFVGVVACLVDLDPDVSFVPFEAAARATAVSQVSHDYLALVGWTGGGIIKLYLVQGGRSPMEST